MKTMMFFKKVFGGAMLWLALGLGSNAMADVMLQVSLNTAKFGAGTTGFLDFSFGGAPDASPITATMSNLQGFDLNPANFELSGDAVALPQGFGLLNSLDYNSVRYHGSFGGVFSFLLTLSGVASDVDFSNFAVLAIDEAFENVLGDMLTLSFVAGPAGELTGQVLALDSETAAVADAASAVPEPGALALLALGMLLMGIARRRQA